MVTVEIPDEVLDTVNKVLVKNGYSKINYIDMWLEDVIRGWVNYNFGFDILYDGIDDYEVAEDI